MRIGFDSSDVMPRTIEELKRTLKNIQNAYKTSFGSEIVDDRKTDNRLTGFMTFNPAKPKVDNQAYFC
ncbi:hypothetical protein COV15_00265 [Candidatus Woesearchaeota archaeon CG10_big_fil_rev_8_21_14_0_10_34_12]|nr:MAG: hypothetical protein COV15_00265 [Candidatus Woesearchaeota archaeon CG10_big_fil_rev_8_21_14_0_10_34_12]